MGNIKKISRRGMFLLKHADMNSVIISTARISLVCISGVTRKYTHNNQRKGEEHETDIRKVSRTYIRIVVDGHCGICTIIGRR